MVGRTEELMAENKYMFNISKNRLGEGMKHLLVNVSYDLQRISDDTEETRIEKQVEQAKQVWSKSMMQNKKEERDRVFEGIK